VKSSHPKVPILLNDDSTPLEKAWQRTYCTKRVHDIRNNNNNGHTMQITVLYKCIKRHKMVKFT